MNGLGCVLFHSFMPTRSPVRALLSLAPLAPTCSFPVLQDVQKFCGTRPVGTPDRAAAAPGPRIFVVPEKTESRRDAGPVVGESNDHAGTASAAVQAAPRRAHEAVREGAAQEGAACRRQPVQREGPRLVFFVDGIGIGVGGGRGRRERERVRGVKTDRFGCGCDKGGRGSRWRQRR